MQPLQKLAGLFLTLFCAASLTAQDYRVLLDEEGQIPVLDYIGSNWNSYEVARYPDALITFPSAVLTHSEPGEILAVYLKTDSLRSVEMTRSKDGGRTWTKEAIRNNWEHESLSSLSLFNAGKPVISTGRRKSLQNINSLMMFSGGNTIAVSSSYTNGEHWSNFYPVNNFGGFRVSSVITLNDGSLMALFHDDGRFLYPEDNRFDLRKSVIYKIRSVDGGLTWSAPQIALKHNLYGLYDATVFYSPAKRDNDLIMIVSERETSKAYISYSHDEGNNWTYPAELTSSLQGDRFSVGTHKEELFIAFRDMSQTLESGLPNPTFGDLVLWTGDLKELTRGHRNGIKVRLADNYPVADDPDPTDRKFYDCGYISVLPLNKNEIAVVAAGRWETQEVPYLKTFVFDPAELRQAAKRR